MSVSTQIEPLVIPTYPVGNPEKNPMFFEKRVYQGSNGKVYPVPFIDKIHDEPKPVSYQSVKLENEFVRLVMLPEIGGRIFSGQDKSNNDYDFFYRQDVIKPALVGLAGPWISGGVEFNWPQHHRPGTFMPADVFIEKESDGSSTVWMSEHDPLNRLKGMHGIRLRPNSSLIELRGRLYNRTPLTQTFLWWANVAAMVHDQYQSFFPPDVSYVADHAVRAISSFPQANNPYYGIDYQNRPGENDLSWYQNIPVPTSYMVCQTKFGFFGGYDFKENGGFVHVANRHVAPGKKQWTWGNHEFGWAWDRELTDHNGPYVELMAGVYTDNQPDFSYLTPYETKTFSQFWWPIQGIGTVQEANDRAALHLSIDANRSIHLGICVSTAIPQAHIIVIKGHDTLLNEVTDLAPGQPWLHHDLVFTGENASEITVHILDQQEHSVLSYRPVDPSSLSQDRDMAKEPSSPADILSAEELYLTGEHLELYRHPTRSPEDYWNEALKRDASDTRSNIGLGRRALRQGQFEKAKTHFQNAIKRLTKLHPNPETGEAFYFLGLTLFYIQEFDTAYDALYKATWNSAWKSAAFYQLACIDAARNDAHAALNHLDESLKSNQDHHKAIVLKVTILRHLGKIDNAVALLESLLKIDPLDHWARHEAKQLNLIHADEFYQTNRNDAQTIIDIALEYAEAGFTQDAVHLLNEHLSVPFIPCAVPNPSAQSAMVKYMIAWLLKDASLLQQARTQSPDYFFPSRLWEQIILEWAIQQPGHDALASYGLGNYFYDLKRHEDAILAWTRSAIQNPHFATVQRNLGIALWNIHEDANAARSHYLKAIELDANDPRLISEYDQLCAKLNDSLPQRLAFLESKLSLVLLRDDCTVALATLYNLTNQPAKALEILTSRRFHPWEGGEGSVLRQFTTAKISLGKQALKAGNSSLALEYFQGAMTTPETLGEAYHLLQAKADVNYWIGMAYKAIGQQKIALEHFQFSANEAGDFLEMAVTAHSPLSYYRGLSLHELGQSQASIALFEDLKAFASQKLKETAKIDYFATSLPNLLVFEENLQSRRDAENHLLMAMALHGLGDTKIAKITLDQAIAFTNSDQRILDLASALDS